MKVSEMITNFRTKIVADKRILSGIMITGVAIISVLGYFGYQEFVKR